MVTEDDAATPAVVTVNVALVDPCATVTLAGTVVTEVLLLNSVTTAPPAGAAPVRVTVPVEALPPTTEVGFTANEFTPGVTKRLAVFATELKVAEIVIDAALVTATVLTGKLAVVEPDGTVTLGGTVATDVLLLASATTAPVVKFRVTVPVDEFPPATLVGFSVSDTRPGVPVCAGPTAVVGSVAAYLRSRKLEIQPIALPQGISPSVPVEKDASLVVNTWAPLIQNECVVPPIAALAAYQTPGVNDPPLAIGVSILDSKP